MVVNDSGHSLTLSRTVAASSEAVFSALTDAAELSTWFTREAVVDLRVGGRYANADKDNGVYLIIDPPGHLRFTWDNAEHCPHTVVDIVLVPRTSHHCEITLIHSKLESEQHVQDMSVGWNWALDSLKSYLETGKPISFETWQKSHQ